MKKILNGLEACLVFIARYGFRGLFFEALFLSLLAWAVHFYFHLIPLSWALMFFFFLLIILIIGYCLSELFVTKALGPKEIAVKHLNGEFQEASDVFFNRQPYSYVIFKDLLTANFNLEDIAIKIGHSLDLRLGDSERITGTLNMELTFNLKIPVELIGCGNIKNVFEFLKRESRNLADLMDYNFQISLTEALEKLILEKNDVKKNLHDLAQALGTGQASYAKAQEMLVPLSVSIADYLRGIIPEDQPRLNLSLEPTLTLESVTSVLNS